MDDERDIRLIMARHVPGVAEPLAVEANEAGALVSADGRQWLVRSIERGRNFERGPGYRLYAIEEGVDGTLGLVAAVAVLPDGRSFVVSTSGSLRDFYAAARTAISPVELASLLAWYHSTADGAESVIAGRQELVERLLPDDLAALPDVAGPAVAVERDGRWQMRFHSLYLSRDPVDRTFRFNINVWHVSADAAGRLAWSSQPVARRLRSPRYLP